MRTWTFGVFRVDELLANSRMAQPSGFHVVEADTMGGAVLAALKIASEGSALAQAGSHMAGVFPFGYDGGIVWVWMPSKDGLPS